MNGGRVEAGTVPPASRRVFLAPAQGTNQMTTEATEDQTGRIADLMDVATTISLARAHLRHVAAFGPLMDDRQTHYFAEALLQLDDAEALAWSTLERDHPEAPKRPS
jgi:hypothetical protein